MHPQAPALVQHGNPRGKQGLVHDERSHDPPPAGLVGGAVALPPELLDPEPGSVDPELDALPAMHEPKLQT
jgi:hypothetical protein